MYCRFLLTHLTDPQAMISKWATQLRPKGLLLMEEVEWIRTNCTIFTSYLAIVQAMLEHHSNTLYVGPVLDELKDSSTLARIMSRVARLQVESHRAATMFFLNMQSWKDRPFVQVTYSPEQISQLERDLHAMMNAPKGDIEIEWGLRQVVHERR
jgi:hypothetical protein